MPVAKMLSPTERSHRKVCQGSWARNSGEPHASFHAGPSLGNANGQQAQEDHQQQPYIPSPEGKGQNARLPLFLYCENSQAQLHQPHTQHSIYAEQSRVGMDGSRI